MSSGLRLSPVGNDSTIATDEISDTVLLVSMFLVTKRLFAYAIGAAVELWEPAFCRRTCRRVQRGRRR